MGRKKREMKEAARQRAAQFDPQELEVEASATAEEANSKLADFAKGQRKREVTKSGMPALPRMPRKSKDRPVHPCECGCGGDTKSRFVPGHDGRTRGWILRIDRELLTIDDVPDGERQVVERKMKERAQASVPRYA